MRCGMKVLVLLCMVMGLSSCNTSIGIYRDTKAGFLWTKERIQGMSSGGGGGEVQEEYGAPIY
jgi:outer membrane protein assembly factor BamE (lipoprotein component of BamABCDE complex)